MERSERAERALRLRGHRERFSRLGWALAAQMAAMLAVQTALLLAAQALDHEGEARAFSDIAVLCRTHRQLELVENYQLVTSGNYILFAISEYADQAVSAFNSYTN